MNIKRKIKICHVLPALKFGGVEQILLNYYSNMDINIFKFEVVYHDKAIKECKTEFETLGIKTYEVPRKNKHPIRNLSSIYKIIKENEYDIVHCHMTLANFVPLFIAWLCGVKVRISHSHLCNIKKGVSRQVLNAFCKLLSRRFATDFFSCGIDAAVYLFGKKIFKQKKVFILKNAINISKFKYSHAIRTKIRCMYGLDTKFVFGHVGRFSLQKNHNFLIDVFKEILNVRNDAHLVLVGTGELESSIIEKVNSLKMQNNVTFIGAVTNAHEFYQAMDIFLLPSLFEGFPIVGIEAQAAGLPCFFSDTITKKVKLISNVRFICLTKDAKHWADEVQIVVNDHREDCYKSVIHAGYDIIHETNKLSKYYISKM